MCGHLLGLRGGVGSSGSHRVVKHKVIPAYGCDSVGATVEPAHTFDKVLVSPISKSTAEEYMISIFNFFLKMIQDWPSVLVWSAKTHISCNSEFKTAREQSSLMEASKEALGWKKKELKFCRGAMKELMILCQDLCLPMCREGKPINSAAVDALHPGRLCSQEVLHSHSAQLITWGTTSMIKSAGTANLMSLSIINLLLGLTKSNGASVVGVPSYSGRGAAGGLYIWDKNKDSNEICIINVLLRFNPLNYPEILFWDQQS